MTVELSVRHMSNARIGFYNRMLLILKVLYRLKEAVNENLFQLLRALVLKVHTIEFHQIECPSKPFPGSRLFNFLFHPPL